MTEVIEEDDNLWQRKNVNTAAKNAVKKVAQIAQLAKVKDAANQLAF